MGEMEVERKMRERNGVRDWQSRTGRTIPERETWLCGEMEVSAAGTEGDMSVVKKSAVYTSLCELEIPGVPCLELNVWFNTKI
jgi:hypothetical protein